MAQSVAGGARALGTTRTVTSLTSLRRLGSLAVILGVAALPFAFFDTPLGAYRGLLNIDYLVAVLVGSAAGGLVGAVFYAAALVADLLRGFGPIFNFGLIDGVAALPLIRHLSGVGGAVIAVGVVLAVCAAAIIAYRQFQNPLRRPSWRVALGLLGLMGSVDLGTRGAELPTWFPTNWAYTGLGSVASALYHDWNDGKIGGRENPQPVQAATDAIRGMLAEGDHPRQVVLILVESWGHPVESKLSSALIMPFFDSTITRIYDVRSGTVPFEGATTSAEVRELCGIRGSHRHMLRIDVSECLPQVFGRAGYRTIALHGNDPIFFDRDHWYPRLGFVETRWRRDLPKEWCGTVVRGTCDDIAVETVMDLLRDDREGRQFVYWLTLTTHWPYDRSYGAKERLCASALGRPEDSDACDLVNGLARTLAVIAQRLPTLPPAEPPYVLVVGDHRPPALRRHIADLFSADLVPFVELAPRRGRHR